MATVAGRGPRDQFVRQAIRPNSHARTGHLDSAPAPRDTLVMARTFYGLHDREIREVTEFYLRLDDAERELAEMLRDEPGWRERFEIVVVDFGGAEVVVRKCRLERLPSR